MLYTKTINDRQVFGDCKTIQMNDGSWISNPTPEQIADAGWIEYIPPVQKLSFNLEPTEFDVIEAVKKMLSTAAAELTDEEALAVAAIYPTWASKIDQPVTVKERLWFNENLYRVIQPHTVQEGWTPDITPALYALISLEE